ncbi:MAG: ABC transporter permease subunit [Gammaproteobacteria bacterium]|nr:ABC transporter permease subunit [Gammaproteobacteria bacterium]
MKNILILAGRELRSLFLSPLAWSILAIVQFIHAYLFMGQLEGFIEVQDRLNLMQSPAGLTEVVVMPVFGSWITIILWLMIVPLLTMRLISEERRNRTISLLFSAPLSLTEIILGKYLGVLGFLILMIALITLMPLSLMASGDLDLGHLLAILLGLFLLSAAFAATGLFMSTLTQYPVVAAISSVGTLLLFLIIAWVGGDVRDDGTSNTLSYLSMLSHYEGLLRGVINSVDVIYFLLYISCFLILGIRRLDADRLQA